MNVAGLHRVIQEIASSTRAMDGRTTPHSEIPADLLSLVYATATDRSKWQEFCSQLNVVCEAPVIMFGHDIDANEYLGSIGSGIDPEQLDSHDNYYAGISAWMNMNGALPMGCVGISDHAMSRGDLFRTQYYNDWLRPQENLIAGASLCCYKSGKKFALLATGFTARGVENTLPRTHKLLEFLAPHLGRSIKMSSALSVGGSTSFSHLHASPHGIILVRRGGQAEFVNNTAECFISSSICMKLDYANRLSSMNEKLNAYLKMAIGSMKESAVLTLPKPFVLKTADFGICIIHAQVFPSEIDHNFPGRAWADPVVGAIEITGKFGIGRADDFGQIVSSFGVTSSETKLAKALLDGLSLYDYAGLNGLSRHTVHNQMRALLAKTGTGNQAEFIRNIMLLASPFTSPQTEFVRLYSPNASCAYIPGLPELPKSDRLLYTHYLGSFFHSLLSHTGLIELGEIDRINHQWRKSSIAG
jgi:DNA-binding CsgD family transcriptional regulator